MKQRFCEICKKKIPKARIEGLPDTRRCVKCAATEEAKGNPEFQIVVTETNLAKIGSLKQGSSSINTRKVRKKAQ